MPKNKSQPMKSGAKRGAAKGGVKGAEDDEKKKRRNRPGTVALREIKKYQKMEDKRLCAKAPLLRRIRDLMSTHDPEMRIQAVALEAVHEAVEAYMVNMLEDANLCCIHAKRQTLMKKDISLAMRIRGDEVRSLF